MDHPNRHFSAADEAAAAGTRPKVKITSLTATGRTLAKQYHRDAKGKITKRSYDEAAEFLATVHEIDGIAGLAALLERISRQRDTCVIRGVPNQWHPGPGRRTFRLLRPERSFASPDGRRVKVDLSLKGAEEQRRRVEAGGLYPTCWLPQFKAQASRVVMIDFDHVKAPGGLEWRNDLEFAADHLRALLPAEFHDVRCWYQATGSAADPTKADLGGDEIRMRLAFVLSDGVTTPGLERWLEGTGADPACFRPVQITYVARPVFTGGLIDPMPVRSGILDGLEDVVPVPAHVLAEPEAEERPSADCDPAASAEGLGLLPSPQLDRALERMAEDGGAPGTVRKGLIAAVYGYIDDVGRDRVDVTALTAALEAAAGQFRSDAEVAAHNIAGIVAWCLQHAPAGAAEDFAEYTDGMADGPEAGETSGKSEQLPEALRDLFASDAKLKAAWASGAKLTGGDDTSPRSLDFSLTVYLARRGHDDELITLALRHYPHGQIGRGLLKGLNAEKRLAKLLEEAERIRAKADRKGDAAAWTDDLLLSEKGTPRDCLANGAIILRQDPVFAGRVRFDELKQAVICRDMPWRSGGDWRDWTDGDDIRFAEWCQLRGVPLKTSTVAEAVAAVADEHRFHPIREYLDGLVWDGVPRLDAWLTTYLGATVTTKEATHKYLQEVGRRWPIAAVARIYRPGCKVDTAPIFEGAQGAGKSQALAALVPNRDWFTDGIADIGTKDAAQDLRGKWIIELAELSAMRRSDVERTKAFISKGSDWYRPSYGRRSQDFPRQCVFAGTTNSDTYLADETGNRRFWPVKVGKIDLEAIRRDRDLLWAEAAAAFKAGEKWWLDAEVEKAAGAEQAERRITDPWEEAVLAWAERQTGLATIEGALRAVGVPQERHDQAAANRIARIFKARGWIRKRAATGGREWGYVRGEPSQSADPSQSAEDHTGTEKASNGAARPSVPVRPSRDGVPEEGPLPPQEGSGARGRSGGGICAEDIRKHTGTTGTDWDGRPHPRGHHAANGCAFDFPPAFNDHTGTPGIDPNDISDLMN